MEEHQYITWFVFTVYTKSEFLFLLSYSEKTNDLGDTGTGKKTVQLNLLAVYIFRIVAIIVFIVPQKSVATLSSKLLTIPTLDIFGTVS